MTLKLTITLKQLIRGLFLFSLLGLIASDIINKTAYRADLEYVYGPLVFCIVVSLFMKKEINYWGYFLIITMAFLTFISTF